MYIIKKVLFICGGNSSEHYISLKSTYSVVSNLDKKLFEYKIVIISFENDWYEYQNSIEKLSDYQNNIQYLEKIKNIIEYLHNFDIIFPLIHGTNGEDGKLQGMLDMFGLKYVGCDCVTSAAMMDKSISKLIFTGLDIPQIDYISTDKNYKIKKIIKQINFPVIVKPSNGGSSLGISKAKNKKELKLSIKEALKYDQKILIEKFIKVRELEVAILKTNNELIISRPGEIKSANNFYDYEAKYENINSYTIIPKDLSKNILDKIDYYCHKIVDNLYIKGLSRIDFFLDSKNNLYINEVNTIPGFTDISMYPHLIKEEGISYQELLKRLINN